MEKQFAVYILASKPRGTLYIGVTSNLPKRVYEHKEAVVEGFPKEHGVKQLVYFEPAESAEAAIAREKQLKNWQRAWKIALIEEHNPQWCDLYPHLAAV